MKRHTNTNTAWIVILLLGATLVTSSAWAQDDPKLDASQVTTRMQEFYKNTADYQASFEQIYTDIAVGEDKKTRGKVFFKKPGKMRWDYLKDKDGKVALEKVLVSDGKAFTIYEPAYKQYFRQCLKDSQLPTALSFLMGRGDMNKEFKPKLIKAPSADTVAVEMIPRKTTGQYKKLVFIVDNDQFAVKEAQIHDPYGNINRIVFKAALINKSLPDSGFDFQIPPGIKAIGSKAECK